MQQNQLSLVLSLTQSAVEGNVHSPPAEVSRRDAAVEHTLKVYDEIESNAVDVVAISDDDVF